MPSMSHIASQVIGTPLLMHPSKLDNIMSWLGPRIASGVDFSAAIQAEEIQHRSGAAYTVADGIAIIPVIGSLVHRGGSMNSSGMTAYQALDANLTMAINDSSVNSILLDIDSPGGQVSGCFDFADRLLEMRKSKQIIAVANDLSASAAYAIGCAASELVVTQTGGAGSIGVVMAHVDYSKQMDESGVAVTYVYAGDHKVAGNPYEPLPAAVKSDMQDDIDGIYQLFTNHVATARGMSQKSVIATQAKVFIGQKAVSAGLADRVGTIETEFARLKAQHKKSGAGSRRFANRQNNEVSMSQPDTTPATAANTSAAITPATVEAVTPAATTPAAAAPVANTTETAASAQTAITEITDAEFQAALSVARSEATTAERDRCISIMNVSKELGLNAAVISAQINSGASAEASGQVMLAIKEGIDASVSIDTQHSAGAVSGSGDSAPSLDYGNIYSKRNAR